MNTYHARQPSGQQMMSPHLPPRHMPPHPTAHTSPPAQRGPLPGAAHPHPHGPGGPMFHPPPSLDPNDFFASLSYSRYTSDLLSAIRLASLGAYVEPGPCRMFWEKGSIPLDRAKDGSGEMQFVNDVLKVCTMIDCSVPWEVRSWKGWTKALEAAGQKNVQERELKGLGVLLRRPDEVLRVTCAAVKALKG